MSWKNERMNTDMNRSQEILEELQQLSDPAYREFHSRLVPGETDLLGVRVPVLRRYAKELYAKADRQADVLLQEIGDSCYEEIMLQGMIIGLQKNVPKETLFAQIEAFVPKIRNWGICDTFCAGLKEVRKYREETWEFLQKYLQSDQEFEIRFGVVMLLDHYLEEAYLPKLFAVAGRIHHEGYYVKMAVAWLLSICFVKYYEETCRFMEHAALDDVTYNKALQKARESLRISKEQKEQLQAMKRR